MSSSSGFSRGFTLIELMVVVAIVGVLAAMAMPMIELARVRADEGELRTALRQIRTGLDDYKKAWDEGRIEKKTGASGYPPSLEVLVNGVRDVKQPNETKIYFLRRLPRDPFNPDISLPPERTWGLRSYASPPDDPAPGADVFDVFSLSDRVGLNGVPYRSW
ncbi:type II secretion system protein [Methyloversatilis sp.]|uniref:type II secretion system protein n=1 Tax=Methyloversatilis sp. TaxID=2569862 RepID=UPI0035AFA2F6